MRGGLTSRTVVASTILAATVGASFVFSLVAISAERDWERQVTGSLEELALVNELERLVIDLETGVRGFLLTHEERFLEPWDEARAAFPDRAEELVGLTDDPVQDPLARQITRRRRVVHRRLRGPARGSGAAQTTRRLRAWRPTAEGKQRVDAIRAQFDRYRDVGSGPARAAPRPRQRRCSASDPRRDGRTRWVAAADRPLCRLHRQSDRDADTSHGRHGRPSRRRRPRHATAGNGHRRDRFARPLVQRHGPLARGESRRPHPAAGGAGRAPAGRHARRPGSAPGRDLRRGRRGGRRADRRRHRRRGSLRDRRCRDRRRRAGRGCRGDAGRDALGTGRCPGDNGGAADRPRRSRRRGLLDGASSPIADELRRLGVRSLVASPIIVEGHLWGAMVAWTKGEPLSPDTEERMANFTELVATAIANAESRAELTASRARIVAAADDTRRRIERDLHDGTQQRLVAVGLELRAAQAMVPPELHELTGQLSKVVQDLAAAINDLQEVSRGIHPAILARGGLGPALRTLARRSALPVELDVRGDRRLPDRVEVAVYYVVSEALTNAAKHARASVVHVDLEADDAQRPAVDPRRWRRRRRSDPRIGTGRSQGPHRGARRRHRGRQPARERDGTGRPGPSRPERAAHAPAAQDCQTQACVTGVSTRCSARNQTCSS